MADVFTALVGAIANCIGPENCQKCEYRDIRTKTRCKTMLLRDALELLKEQEEPVKPVFVGNDEWQCPECETAVGWKELDYIGIEETKYNYCPGCGRKVKWDD